MFVTIELGKFRPKTAGKKDLLDAWLKFLTNPADEEALKEQKIHKAFDTLTKLSASDEVREIYRLRETTEKDRISEQTEARKAGREEGARNKAIETARKMLLDGLSIDIISKYSGLSIEEIERLK